MKKENILAAMMFGGSGSGGGGGSGDVLFVTVTRDANGDVTGSMSALEAYDAQAAGKTVIINLNDRYEVAGGQQFVAIPRSTGNYGLWSVVRTTDPFDIARAAAGIYASSEGWGIENVSSGYANCLVIGRAGVPYFINNNDEEIIPDYMHPREEYDFGDTMGTLISYAMQSANPEITLTVDLSAPGTLNIMAAVLQTIRDRKFESPAILFEFTTIGTLTVSASLTNILTATRMLQESFNFTVQSNAYADGALDASETYDFTLSFEVTYDDQDDPKHCAGTLTCKRNTATIVPMS